MFLELRLPSQSLLHELPLGIQADETLYAAPVLYARHRHLNRLQTVFFLLLAAHRLKREADPSLPAKAFFCTGNAGTGKSNVLKTYRDWLAGRDQMKTTGIASAFGSAAALIGGSTFASLIGMRIPNKSSEDELDIQDALTGKGTVLKVTDSLRDRLGGQLQCIIDEVSTLGHRAFNLHNQTMNAVKDFGSGGHFGNVDTIYFGDLLQMKCVQDIPLYENPPKNCFNHWKSIENIVILNQVMRQQDDQLQFVALLNELRERQASEVVYRQLYERLVGSAQVPDLSTPLWLDALFITTRHTLKRLINKEKALSLSIRTGSPCYLYRATYRPVSSDSIVVDPNILIKLGTLSPNDHGKMEGEIYITLGMPIVLVENGHTLQGLVNGAYGIL